MTIAETDQSVVPPVPPAPSAPPAPPRKRDTIFSVFDPKGKHLITAIIIGLNVLVFIAMAISGVNLMEPTSENLLKWGANFRPFTLQGEWWRLLTCCFLHIGIFHLLINMYALLYIGIMLEPLLGRTRYLVAYLLTGLLSSVASLAWNAYTVSAGASGAIFGVYGVFLALLTMPHLIHPQIRKPLIKKHGLVCRAESWDRRDRDRRCCRSCGGLVSGLLMGYAYYPSLRKPWNSSLRNLTIVVAIIAAIGLSFFIYHKVPDDIVRYDQKMKIFASRDSLAIATFNQLADLPKGKERDDLQAKGIQYFQQNIALLSDAANLRLPAVLQERNRKMIKYCMSQITYHQLQVKSLDGDAPVPDGGIKKQLEFYSRQLDTLNKELGEDDK